MSPLVSIVLSSHNEGKLRELRALLEGLPIELLSVQEALGEPLPIVEDGATFQENAILKAQAVCRATRMIALADDSGLEVSALGGRPSVRSARFAHARATDAENNAALLAALESVAERAACFRCVLAVITPWNATPLLAEGTCSGQIALAPRGCSGFGYDPLFVVDGLDGRAMAELSAEEKNRVSHRARAVRALRPLLIDVVNQQLDEAERAAG